MRFLVVVLGMLALAAPAQGAIADVTIIGQAFNPPMTTIDQGDSVRWTNNDFVQHNVTFAGALSNTVTPGNTYVRLFPTAGTFSYLCTLHVNMDGSVKVIGPTAFAQADPRPALTGQTVTFDGSGSSYNGPAPGGIASYEWDFQDTATDSGEVVTHSFATPGVYDVELTVTDEKGATDTDTVRVRVADTFVKISNRRLREGNRDTRPARFTVTLTVAPTVTTTVAYRTANGTARAPSDFVGKTGTLTFQPGQTAKTVVVRIKGDRRKERNETFTVRLSNPTNALIIDDRGLGTIVNDD